MLVSVATAALLAGVHPRTVRRWSAAGTIGPIDHAELRARVPLDDRLLRLLTIALDADDVHRLRAADAGDPDAANDVALLLLAAGRQAQALPWLEAAAAGGCTDAMHWLGRRAIDAGDQRGGIAWLSRSASAGHRVSAELLDSLLKRPVSMSAR